MIIKKTKTEEAMQKRSTVAITIAVLAICSWASLPVEAADEDAVMIYGSRDNGAIDPAEAVSVLRSAIPKSELPGRYINVHELGFPSVDPVWIAGDVEIISCLGPDRQTQDISGLLTDGIQAIDYLDHEQGQELLARAIKGLSCMPFVIERDDLVNLFYYYGIASFHMGDAETARADFRRALAINPSLEWDTNYPPEPQQVFLLAKGDTLELERMRMEMSYDLSDSDVTDFYFDGVLLESVSGTTRIVPGTHYIQYSAEGTPHSRVLEVAPADSLVLVTHGGYIQAVIDGPGISETHLAVQLGLGMLVADEELESVYVVILEDNHRQGDVYSFLDTYAVLVEDVAVTGRRPVHAQPDTDYSRVGLTLNAGLTHAFGSPYAGVALRGNIRLYHGLELDFGGGVNMASFTDDEGSRWLALFPGFRVGARYRFTDKVVQPYVGGALLVSLWRSDPADSRVAPGGALLAGVNIRLTSAVYLNVEVDVGFSRGSAWFAPGGGVGFRF